MLTILVVPTYNERENIENFLRTVRGSNPEVSILIVDDSSPDGTADLAESLSAELGPISVLRRDKKKGLGSAYRHGFAVALLSDPGIVVTMDADLSHDPAVIPAMERAILDGSDAAVGSRYVPGGGTVHWPRRRRLLSKWGNRFTGSVLRLGIQDCTSGFRAYRAAALRAIDPGSTSAEGYAFLTELLRRLNGHGFRLVEVPITFRDREKGVSKMSGRIIVESMMLVTRWGIADAVQRHRSSTAPSTDGFAR